MFNKNKEIEKRKIIVDETMNLYRRERVLEIGESLLEQKEQVISAKKALQVQFTQGQMQAQEYEDEWHQNREQKRVELAEIDALVKTRVELVDAHRNELDAKDQRLEQYKEEVKRLTTIVKDLTSGIKVADIKGAIVSAIKEVADDEG